MLVSANTSDKELAERIKAHPYICAEVPPEEWETLAKEIIEKTTNAKCLRTKVRATRVIAFPLKGQKF